MTNEERFTDILKSAHKECKGTLDCHKCEVYGNGSYCVYMLFAKRLVEAGATFGDENDTQRVNGHWIVNKFNYNNDEYFRIICSVCNASNNCLCSDSKYDYWVNRKFCPICGSAMTGQIEVEI